MSAGRFLWSAFVIFEKPTPRISANASKSRVSEIHGIELVASIREYALERLDRLLRAAERPRPERAKGLNAAAELAATSGDPAESRPRAEEALALHRKLRNRWGTALSLCQLGETATLEADLKKNEQRPEE